MSSCEFQLRQRGEFVAVDAALSARRPRIALRELLRIGEAAEQGFAVGNIVDHLLADSVEANPIAPLVHALQVPALLAIELCQRGDDFERLFLGRYLAQELGSLDVKTGGAGEMNLEPGIDADHANVLAGCFRAIARATGYGELHLG